MKKGCSARITHTNPHGFNSERRIKRTRVSFHVHLLRIAPSNGALFNVLEPNVTLQLITNQSTGAVQGDMRDYGGRGGVDSSFERQLIRMSHTTSVLGLIPPN